MFSKTLKTSLAVVLFGFACNAVQAVPLGLTLADEPDIAVGFIDVAYTAATDTLTADGFAITIDVDAAPPRAIAGGGMSLVATVDSSGALSGGTVTVTGTVASLGFVSGTLLTGNLTEFGFPDAGGDPLGFLFDVTGGDAASLYGAHGGFILTFAGFTGDWTADFANGGFGEADVAATIPLPAPFVLLLTALIGVGATSRRR